MVSPGIDRVLAEPSLLPRGRIGLVTNHSAVTRDLRPTADALLEAGFEVVALFGPEHGIRGDAAAGEEVAGGTDTRTGLPVFSLYGPTRKPTPEMLKGVDCLVFDMQDAGCRFYTYLSTLSCCLEAAGENGIPIIVLDRPNPLGGDVVEGPLVRTGYDSFVGYQKTPIRYGLTIGEYAVWVRNNTGADSDLTVITVEGWRRGMDWRETGLQWVMPSPNIPAVDTVRVYPGTCLIEGTTLSEGRGTSKPFEIFGAPWVDADALAETLNGFALPGARWRPVHFTPTFSKHNGTPCHGCQLHITDADAFRPVTAGVHLLCALKALYPGDFAWLPPFTEGRPPFIDLLAGSPALREAVDAGVPASDIVASWQADLDAFKPSRRAAMLYTD
jgi:uncharacterized protein YbbC (DUF1343 family)